MFGPRATATAHVRRARHAARKCCRSFSAVDNQQRSHHAVHHVSEHMTVHVPFANRRTWRRAHETRRRSDRAFLDRERKRIGGTEGPPVPPPPNPTLPPPPLNP